MLNAGPRLSQGLGAWTHQGQLRHLPARTATADLSTACPATDGRLTSLPLLDSSERSN